MATHYSTSRLRALILCAALVGIFTQESRAQQECASTLSSSITVQTAKPYGNSLASYTPTEMRYVRVAVHIIRDSENPYPQFNFDAARVSRMINRMNTSFASAMIGFVLKSTEEFYTADYGYLGYDNSFDTTKVFSLNPVAGHLNLYITPSIALDGSNYNGIARLPGSAFAVAYSAADSSTVVHEVGHCLGLYHTFETVLGIEKITRDLSASCPANYETAGDLLGDTPADGSDYNNASTVSDNCQNYILVPNDLPRADPCGETNYSPDVKNFMTYRRYPCRSRFTPQQIQRMNYFLTALLSGLVEPNPVISVNLANRIGTTGVPNSTLNLDGVVTGIPSSAPFLMVTGQTYTSRTNHERFNPGHPGISLSVPNKHRIWDNTGSQFRLGESFLVNVGTSERTAEFFSVNAATVKSELLDAPSVAWGNVEVNDPWYFNGTTQPNTFVPYTASSPFASSYGYGNTGGVFLGLDPLNSPAFYSARAALTQSTGGYTGYFQNWNTVGASVQQVGSNPSGYNQRAIVFQSASSTVAASYKGQLLSSFNTATGGSGQRRLIQYSALPGHLALTYESQNKIWLTYSTNNGASWQPEILCGTGVNPSLAASPQGAIYVVWYDPTTNHIPLYSLYEQSILRYIDTPNNPNFYPSASRPSLAVFFGEFDYAPHVAVVYEAIENATGQGCLALYSSIGGTVMIPNTRHTNTAVAVNPSMDSYIAGTTLQLRIAWETYLDYAQDPAVTLRNGIGFINADASFSSGTISFSPASGTGFTADPIEQQTSPSVVADASGNKFVAWQGYYYVNYPYQRNVAVCYQQLNASNYEGFPLTVFSNSSQNYSSPSVQRESNGAISIYFQAGNSVRQVRKTSGSSAWSAYTLATNGGAPNAVPFSDARRLAYTQSAGAPYRLGFLTGSSGDAPNDLDRSAQGGKGFITTASENSGATDSLSGCIQATSLSVRDTTRGRSQNAFVNLSLTNVLLGNENIGAAAVPDTFSITAQNLLSLLASPPAAMTEAASLIIASAELRAKDLNRFGKNIKVWFDLCNAESGATLASSVPVSIASNDTLRNLTATFSAAQANGQAVVIKVRTEGFKLKADQKVGAMNLILMDENAVSSRGAVMTSTASTSASRTVASVAIPTAFELSQNYPNPFNPSTTIRYALPQTAKVSVRIYDMLGRVVSELVNETKPAGYYEARFDASRLSSGTYFYRLTASGSSGSQGSFVETKKMVLVK